MNRRNIVRSSNIARQDLGTFYMKVKKDSVSWVMRLASPRGLDVETKKKLCPCRELQADTSPDSHWFISKL
jgi:hypothetical protein